ncbi:MAG: hypothetical protein ABI729_07625 [Chitinophagales bacterium]
MENNPLTKDNRKLPYTLGYGILNESSITCFNEVLSADYVFDCDDTVAHHVVWSEDRCVLTTFFHGMLTSYTTYPDLEKALLYQCLSWKLEEDAAFLHVAREVCRAGNIFVNYPKTDKKNVNLGYFPAGKIFIYTLPLLEKTKAYTDFLEQISERGEITLFRERNGHLLQATTDGQSSAQPLVLAEFVVTLPYLVRAAKTFAAAGVIAKEKRLRLVVTESAEAEAQLMQTFTGDEQQPPFAIVFREVSAPQLKGLQVVFASKAKQVSNVLLQEAKDEKEK